MDAERPIEEPPGAVLRFEHRGGSGELTVRDARARAPAPDADALRTAYLELLKLALCDLCGPSTISIWKDTDGTMMARELAGDALRIRAIGGDWPLQGVSMAGLHRLDDLQRCVEAVVADGVEGDLIEAGTWRGGSSILMRATLDALGATDRTVWVADSFDGFPTSDDREGPQLEQLTELDYLAVPLDDVKANFARFGLAEGVRFVRGFFEETMPRLPDHRWAVVRLDGDSYEATRTTLEALYPGLSVGGHLIVDDYGALEECRHAVDEFRARHAIAEPLEQVDWTCVRWRRTSEAPIGRPPAPSGDAATGRGITRPRGDRASTVQALLFDREEPGLPRKYAELGVRAAMLEEQLTAARAELERLTTAPADGRVSRLRRRLRRAPPA
jgi:Macrocin-O-methyltransferase (TylF)